MQGVEVGGQVGLLARPLAILPTGLSDLAEISLAIRRNDVLVGVGHPNVGGGI